MNIVITGSTSMIGCAIIDEWLKDSNVGKIFAIIRKNTNRIGRIPKSQKIVIVECSINDYDSLPILINSKCDVFYHIAWDATGEKRNDNCDAQISNIKYSLDALYAAKKLGCSLFIGAGSQAEYGILDIEKIAPNSPTNPTQPYGIAKYAAGRFVSEVSKSLGICCIWVRIFSVYGIYDKTTTMISSVLSKMMKNEHIAMSKGEQMWDYLFSSDAGKAFYLIGVSNIKDNRIYCLGSGNAMRIIDYIQTMKAITNSSSDLGVGELDYKNNVMHLCANISDLTKDTGWVPAVSFETGIKTIYDYYRYEKKDNT